MLKKVKNVEFGALHTMDEMPEKDGLYVVFNTFMNGVSYMSTLQYLVGYGWNCHRMYKGDVNTEHRMFEVPENEVGYYWTEAHVEFEDPEETEEETE